MKSFSQRRIIVLGATGYTGGLVGQELVAQGVRPVLAGRNAARLRHLAEQHGNLEVAVVDASDSDDLKALFGPEDVVISTVGPFERFGRPVAEAAAHAGSHYLDSTGEVGFVHELIKGLDDDAKATGSTMLPAFGFDYVPGLLAGALATQSAGAQARGLRIGYFHIGPMNPWVDLSAGTRQTLADSGGSALPSWRNPTLVNLRPGSASAVFSVTGKRRRALRLSGTEVLFLPRSLPGLDTVEVYNGWFPTRPAQALMAVSGVMAKLPLVSMASAPGWMIGTGGPDTQQRERQRMSVVAVALDGRGNALSQVSLEGPNTYTLTARLLAWGARELAVGSFPAGVLSPVEVFGLQRLEDGAAHLGLIRV
ncbi:saccharopine dehydrogenase family protein [Kocuria sp.]|uniref:saccharopine dehydrogenase family protein n=1 Tax=Kocuria sp. TaxID=1871328 RepID=UPI0026DEA530|nr:saccharopine dehydrogenase NADP-binding domain-containing protein [Kocuria sp.]MDO5619139.1 saccharopine dehydrogenase NADP-binding domain-containing protein [Kocuria sp.]